MAILYVFRRLKDGKGRHYDLASLTKSDMVILSALLPEFHNTFFTWCLVTRYAKVA